MTRDERIARIESAAVDQDGGAWSTNVLWLVAEIRKADAKLEECRTMRSALIRRAPTTGSET